MHPQLTQILADQHRLELVSDAEHRHQIAELRLGRSGAWRRRAGVVRRLGGLHTPSLRPGGGSLLGGGPLAR